MNQRIWLRRVIALLALLTGALLILAGLVMTVSAEQPALPQPANFALSHPPQATRAATRAQTQAHAPDTRPIDSANAPARAAAPAASSSAHRSAPPPAATPVAPDSAPEVPLRIIIPAINLDAPVKPVTLIVSRDSRTAEWGVPSSRTSGWHSASARLGEPGNLVLNGHHNIRGRVFARVKELQPLDQIIVIGARRKVTYEVSERKLLLERGQPLAVRIENAQWIMPTDDTRLTLVTCWPPTYNSHRLVVIARPVAEEWLQGAATGP